MSDPERSANPEMKIVVLKTLLAICQFFLIIFATVLASWIGYPGEGDGIGMRSFLFSFPASLLSFLLLKGILTWKKAGVNLLICITLGIILGRINFYTA
ncbi:MAG: hypothetical protein K0R17_1247 [Rariglobus sp.]|jgi:hypothetical protein|nr:hypothetical protein [Rariglobus sp.]